MAAPDWIIDAFGVAAGLCSMASFVPQIVKIMRERDASGVSLIMYGVTIAGFCCWVTYGVLRDAWPVAVSNGVCVVLTAAIIVLRLKFGDNSPRA
ncbi:MAG: SemiSWEET transporter [Terricaulis sp.]